MDIKTDGIVDQARDLVETYIKPTLTTVTDPVTKAVMPILLTKDGFELIASDQFDEYRERPIRTTGRAVLTEIDSFIAHVNRFSDKHSALFADDSRTAPSITAVYDYHEGSVAEIDGGARLAGASDTARFCDHTALFNFPLSDEWKAWTAKNGTAMKMAEFAAFLEDRIIDIDEAPAIESLNEDMSRFVSAVGVGAIASPNKLMELARGLKIHESAAVEEAVNLATGEVHMRFATDHRDEKGAPLKVPGLFLLSIPVFRHGDVFRVAARLRYRKTGEGVVFFYELWRIDRVFDVAFTESCNKAKDDTALPLFIGKPE